MKKVGIILIALCIAIASFAQGTVEDDNENGTSLKPILLDSEIVIKKIEDENLEIVRMEVDILKDRKVASRMLYDSWEYGIAVVGDYRFKELDLKLYKRDGQEWVLVAEDVAENGKVSIVTHKPESTEEYKIEIIAVSHSENYTGGHYALFVFH